MKLSPHDLLFCYTDGLSEAMDNKNVEFGEDRIVKYLQDNHHQSPDEIKEGILSEMRNFATSTALEDDTTIVILKVNG